jgi:hypothetical protein
MFQLAWGNPGELFVFFRDLLVSRESMRKEQPDITAQVFFVTEATGKLASRISKLSKKA